MSCFRRMPGKYKYPSAIYSASIKPFSVLHSGLKRECQPNFQLFVGKKKLKNKKNYKSFFMQLCSADTTKLKINKNKFFLPTKS